MKVNFKEENSLYKKMSANFCYFRDYESEVGIFFLKQFLFIQSKFDPKLSVAKIIPFSEN